MNRRGFLKAIATIGAVACVPAALLPAWKRYEPAVLTFRGIPLRYDKNMPSNKIYFLSKDRLHVLATSTVRRVGLPAGEEEYRDGVLVRRGEIVKKGRP